MSNQINPVGDYQSAPINSGGQPTADHEVYGKKGEKEFIAGDI